MDDENKKLEENSGNKKEENSPKKKQKQDPFSPFNYYNMFKNKGEFTSNNKEKRNNPLLSRNTNSPLSNAKNKIGSSMLDKASSLHPVLKGINTLNKVKNGLAAAKKNKEDNNTSDDSKNQTSENQNSNDDNNNNNENNDNNEKKLSNPLSNVFNSPFSSKLSFFAKLPTPLKLAIIFGGPLLSLLTIMLPFIIIISFFNGMFDSDDLVSASGNSVGNIDYADYQLNSEGDQILNQPLDQFLQSHGSSIDEFNNLISSNVQNAGLSTRAGVVSAAVTLIAELGNNYNVKIPYFWGGGHGRVSTGASGNWGSSSCYTRANGTVYNLCGLDCSGFVTWALYNGGFTISPRTAGTFKNLPGARRVTLENRAILSPGDILESEDHIVLVVAVENNKYICAEASGRTTGVRFTERSFTISGYWGVKMDEYYNTQARS